MTYICENNQVKAANNEILGTIISIDTRAVVIRKSTSNGVIYLPINSISFSYKGGQK